MTRTVAIVQARMGSTRLPGKVLQEIGGVTMLGRVVGRLCNARTIDDVVIATSTHSGDDAVVEEGARLGTSVHRGSESDVLDRYLGAARMANADVVIRATADCPLLDPDVIDGVVYALRADVDYASNTHVRTYPRGLDIEAFHRDTLERIARLATSASAREHVTAFLVEQPSLFRTRQVRDTQDNSDLRWTVDTPEDLALVRELAATGIAGYRELVRHVRRRPELMAINGHVVQKQLHVG